MRRWYLVVTMLFAVVPCGADDKATPLTFSRTDLDKLPKGWSSAKTGEGTGSVWKVVADDSVPSRKGHALAQTAAGPTRLFNICVLDGSSFKDGEITVQVRAVGGKIDMGGGIAWRYHDANNYYVCRYNPLEENFRVYHVKEGKRTQLATKENVLPPANPWFKVSIAQTGSKIACSLDGKVLLEVSDETFPYAGKVGLWTKADAQTNFDSLSIQGK